MNKRLISFLLALSLLTLTACSQSSSKDSSKTDSSSSQTETVTSETTTTTTAATSSESSSQSETTTAKTTTVSTEFPEKTEKTVYDPEGQRKVYTEQQQGKDTDTDGLPDSVEAQIKTDPKKKDTDGDGLTDYEEYCLTGTDPLVRDSKQKGVDDTKVDLDNDGLSNETEIRLKTNPKDPDTDHDGLSDGDEVNIYHTDPLKPDTDGDGIFDGDELAFGTDPLNIQTNGKNDTERFTSCKVYPYDPALDGMNRANENYYNVSLIYDAFDGTPQLTGTSRNRSVIKNYPDTTVLGKGVAFIQPKGAMLKNGIVFFKVDENFIRDKLAGRQANDIKGIYRLKVYGVNREWGDYVPLETKYDPDTNIVYARTQQYTEFELINYKNDNDFLT